MSKSDTFKNQERKRGRPAGKNRVPLSVEERRARNAQYERERRTETTEAMSDLACALGCEDTTSNADILATALQELQRAAGRHQPSDDILELRRCNAKLIQQIEDIEKRLTTWEDRHEQRSKKNGVIKKKDKINKKYKIKDKKISTPITGAETNIQDPTEADHHTANEPSPTEASACEDSQFIKTEPIKEELIELDSIAAECPVNDWGIYDLMEEYL